MRLTAFATTLVLVAATAARAGSPPVVDMNRIGDGAALCAEAKTAMASLPHHAPLSVASANIDITYYHLDLTVDLVGHVVSGTVRIEGNVVGSPMSVLTLDLASSMSVSAVALADATPLAFTHPGAALDVTLPSTVSPGGAVAIDVTYSGTPVQGGFGNFVFGTRNGDLFAWSLSEPYGAREWWPCKDHPSDKADSVRVTVTVPSVYRVGSQGLLVAETVNGGTTTYDWLSHYPISSYLVSVSIGQYVRYQNTYTRSASLATQYGPLSMPLDDLVYDDGSSALPTAGRTSPTPSTSSKTGSVRIHSPTRSTGTAKSPSAAAWNTRRWDRWAVRRRASSRTSWRTSGTATTSRPRRGRTSG